MYVFMFCTCTLATVYSHRTWGLFKTNSREIPRDTTYPRGISDMVGSELAALALDNARKTQIFIKVCTLVSSWLFGRECAKS